MWATLHPNWATYSTGRTFVQFLVLPECRTVRHRNKGTQVRYQNAMVPDWEAGCGNTSNVNDTKTESTNVPISKLIIETKPKRFDVFQKMKSNISI
jgi:hypothetical protein